MHARIDFRNVMCAARFEQNRLARVAQDRHQWEDAGLEQRFAAGNLDERTFKTLDTLGNFFKRRLLAFIESVFRIAIVAAQIAEGEPDENAALARPGAFTLDRLVNFVDRQPLLCVCHEIGSYS